MVHSNAVNVAIVTAPTYADVGPGGGGSYGGGEPGQSGTKIHWVNDATYCTMGAGIAALQMMIPDEDINKNTQSSRVAKRIVCTVVRLHRVQALAHAVQHKHAVQRCDATSINSRQNKTRNPLEIGRCCGTAGF